MLFTYKKLIKSANINYVTIDCAYNFFNVNYTHSIRNRVSVPFRVDGRSPEMENVHERERFKWDGAYRDTESWSEQVPNLLSLAHANST